MTQTQHTKTSINSYWVVVVYSGSTCMSGCCHHVSQDCGHKHKTLAAAERCEAKLKNWSPDGRTCSATWYHSSIEERDRKTGRLVLYSWESGEKFLHVHKAEKGE